MSGQGVGPGGPRLSSAKKRRLAALEQRSGQAPPAKRPAPPPTAAPSHPGTSLPTTSGPLAPQHEASQPLPQPKSTSTPTSHPIYAPLPAAITGGAVGHQLRLLHTEGTIASLLEGLMATNPRASDARAIAGGKLRDKALLLDNPDVRQERGRRGGHGPVLTASLATRKDQRAAGLYNLKSQSLKYEAVEPLHRRWKEYLQQSTIAAKNLKEVQERLYSLDLHGCMLRVAECLSQQRHVGLCGVVVRDSRTAFQIITPDDRLILVPKKGSVFEYQLDQRRAVVLLGDGLMGVGDGSNKPQKKGSRGTKQNK